MKRVFIIHGWEGFPEEGWFPWLKAELEKKGYAVTVPAMPRPERPTIEDWVPFLASVVGKPDTETYFVGHSIGCQAILRYLEKLPAGTKVGGAVFVAGWFTLQNIEPDTVEMVKPWLTVPIDFIAVRKILERSRAIFSTNDKWVPVENKKLFEDRLGLVASLIESVGERGHFSGSDGVKELPEALAVVLEIMKEPVISIDDFAKVQIKMGKILTAERIEGSDKLLKLSIDLGEAAPRTICSGIAQYYQPEEVIGKMVPVITNLAPRKMRGIESNGMVLFGIDETDGAHVPVMLNPHKDLPSGSPVQ